MLEHIERFELKDIVISEDFTKTPPRAEKLLQKDEYFNRTGRFESEIVVNEDNVLIDGYSSYLLAMSYGIKEMSVFKGSIRYAKCEHKKGGQEYVWRVPFHLANENIVGRKCIVRTERGLRKVRVKEIFDIDYPIQKRYVRNVIRVA